MFSALSEERIFSGSEHRREDSRRRWLSVAFVALAYALVVGAVFYQRAIEPPPQPEEIPVEIVVEQPPPPPPSPPAAQPAPQPTEAPKPPDVDLTPAHELPKAGTAETDNGDKEKDAKAAPAPDAEDKTHDKLSGAEAKAEAPKPEATPEPAPSPEPTPTPEASATPEPTPVETPMPDMKTTPDGEIPAAAASPPKPQPESTAPPAPAKAEPPAGKSKFAPMFAALPDVEFGGAAIKSPGGGAARGTYLTIVYGMIMPRVHKPNDARSMVGRGHGAVVFSVDGQGRLVDRWIAEPSGSPELDRAVFNAIGAAGPFPPPPARGTVQLRFTYDGG